MVFAMQMMLMLVLGHVLALSQPVNKGIKYMTAYCNNTANAAFGCAFHINSESIQLGLGLIFGQYSQEKLPKMQ